MSVDRIIYFQSHLSVIISRDGICFYYGVYCTLLTISNNPLVAKDLIATRMQGLPNAKSATMPTCLGWTGFAIAHN